MDSISAWFPPRSFRAFSTTLTHFVPARPFILLLSHTALSTLAGNLSIGTFLSLYCHFIVSICTLPVLLFCAVLLVVCGRGGDHIVFVLRVRPGSLLSLPVDAYGTLPTGCMTGGSPEFNATREILQATTHPVQQKSAVFADS